LTSLLNLFDGSSLRARLFPAIFASAPLLVLIALVMPWRHLSWVHAVASIAIPVILFVAADIARRAGKKMEPVMYRRWGGKPTTRMLRHRDPTLDANTKAAYLAFLADKIGAPPPCAREEASDPAKADAYYERCGAWLRENTRSTKKFSVLFGENVTYGYRRNLLALKVVSLTADIVIVIGSAIAFAYKLPAIDGNLELKLALIAAFAVVHGTLLTIAVSETSLKEASEIYARQLLLSCEAMQSRR
jgi:hypothetical protein